MTRSFRSRRLAATLPVHPAFSPAPLSSLLSPLSSPLLSSPLLSRPPSIHSTKVTDRSRTLTEFGIHHSIRHLAPLTIVSGSFRHPTPIATTLARVASRRRSRRRPQLPGLIRKGRSFRPKNTGNGMQFRSRSRGGVCDDSQDSCCLPLAFALVATVTFASAEGEEAARGREGQW